MIHGLFGQPYLNLEPLLGPALAVLPRLEREITHGLSLVDTSYTGGSHRSMGIMPPSRVAEAHVDYGEALRAMSADDFHEFLALGDETRGLPVSTPRDVFGEERTHPLSFSQMRLLKIKHGVYFPWKAFYQLIETEYWDDKDEPREFTREARLLFPETVAFVRALPFVHIGRCNLLGLEANDHGTTHRDRDPATQTAPDHFLTISPRGNKRLFLWDEEGRRSVFVEGRAYWFNDADYHGVAADPFFRWSLRVDGVFEPAFLERVIASAGAPPVVAR